MDVEIRRAVPEDLPSIVALWLEKMALQQIGDRRLRLAPDGAEMRAHTMRNWLQDENFCLLVALARQQTAGFVVGCERPGQAGLLPLRQGHVLELTVDLHSDLNGLGGKLWAALCAWFRQRGLQEIIVHVSGRQAVEQAFWHSLGATEMTGLMRVKA